MTLRDGLFKRALSAARIAAPDLRRDPALIRLAGYD